MPQAWVQSIDLKFAEKLKQPLLVLSLLALLVQKYKYRPLRKCVQAREIKSASYIRMLTDADVC
jgi:hypothetical protein